MCCGLIGFTANANFMVELLGTFGFDSMPRAEKISGGSIWGFVRWGSKKTGSRIRSRAVETSNLFSKEP